MKETEEKKEKHLKEAREKEEATKKLREEIIKIQEETEENEK